MTRHEAPPNLFTSELVDAACALVAAERADAAKRIVADLERRGCRWFPLGGKEGNFGLVNIGSDPALAFVERITNAIDGVLERSAREALPSVVAELDSPRDASRALFGIADGRLGALDDASLAELARSIAVSIGDGSSASKPTLEVRDRGVGIAADAMPRSILDLAGSNKLDKPYLAGAYGQGGSTTFGFTAGGSIVASSPDGRTGGVTYVRFTALDPLKNKNGRYEYLVGPDGGVPRFDADRIAFERGTLVRHFDYELPRHVGLVDAATGLLGLASAALFDPVLPVRLIERRSRRGVPRDDVVFAGAARRLERAGAVTETHQSLGVPLGRRGRAGLVRIRYWLLADREDAAIARPDDRHVVFVTNFGQTHDLWPKSFAVEDLRLPFLKHSLVVQVELDALTPLAKRELLSTTRDRLKRGDLFTVLHDAVRDALRDERALVDANATRRRTLLAKQRAADQERLQKRFAELMETFRPGQFPALSRNGRTANDESTRDASGSPGADASPLPTGDRPTFIRFAAADVVELPRGRSVRVVLESDAPDAYLARVSAARLLVAPDPPDAVAFVRATDFRSGRARVVVRAEGDVGACGTLVARLGCADGSVLAANVAFRVVAAPPTASAEPDGPAKTGVPSVFEVSREGWAAHDFDGASVAAVSESADDFSIFVNVDNVHLARLAESVSYQQTGLTRMRTAFVVQAAFYAFLLHRAHRGASREIDGEVLERYERLELDRVAQTIVSSIAAIERIDAAALFDTD